jgi:hypothetical protein
LQDSISFYLQQARSCARAADEATLPNQREKYRLARRAWQALAERAVKIRREREKRSAEREEAQNRTDHEAE